jgi:hypothetical protein
VIANKVKGKRLNTKLDCILKNFHPNCGLSTSNNKTLLANCETLHHYFPITDLNTSSHQNLELKLHALIKDIHNSVIVNQRGCLLNSQVYKRGAGKKIEGFRQKMNGQ